jgi:sporulation protein YlmC with PRC-barrel domain
MPEKPFEIGADVHCIDGHCGHVIRVIIDPVAKVVTHLVVGPRLEHGSHVNRLVPVDLAEVTADGIKLNCTLAGFAHLDPADETEFMPAGGLPGYLGYGSEQALSWRYYGLAWGQGTGDPDGLDSSAGPGRDDFRRVVKYDSVPLGGVQIRHGDSVQATDGEVGKVEGLVIDPDNHQVTHVLLQEGHLWGQKEVAIPIGAVTDAEAGIRLNLSKEQVENLPPVAIDR